MKFKKFMAWLIVFALSISMFPIIASANPSSYWCLRDRRTGCNHCSGHTMQNMGTATANCITGGGQVRQCMTSGCGATFYQTGAIAHSFTNSVCLLVVTCGQLNITSQIQFTHYMYRTGNHARRVLPANRFQTLQRPTHNGIDIMSNNGAAATFRWPIFVQGDGVVESRSGTQPHSTMGHFIIIDYDNGLRVRYLHLNSRPTLSGRVNHTQQIGETGWTGDVDPKNIDGTHLHLDVQRETNLGTFVNPESFFPAPTITFNFS